MLQAFRRLVVLAIVLAVIGLAGTSQAASSPSQLSARHSSVTWQGKVGLAPLNCAYPVGSCDQHSVIVEAAKGAWITISIGVQGANVRVTSNGSYVGSGGESLDPNPNATSTATTTFQQLRSGRVGYLVEVGSLRPLPEAQTPVGGSDNSYVGRAQLTGKAFDRAGDCGATSGLEHVHDLDTGDLLHLSVRLVADPKDQADVRRAGAGLTDAYRRINVALRVSYEFRPIRGEGQANPYPYQQVRRAYGGVRPKGVDVVHVMSDLFAGGFADCIGGIAYPEKAFSTGSVHYGPENLVRVDTVRAALVAAHEIGHQLGGQHQQSNCVEALPQLALRPASDGSVGPCTVMGASAVLDSETFSTPERATMRYFVRRYAKG